MFYWAWTVRLGAVLTNEQLDFQVNAYFIFLMKVKNVLMHKRFFLCILTSHIF